ncbi:hypothetical protein [Sandaracinus amylolyticus]|uniref:Cytochrome b561 domain-containing protein n=1 Tax=Sandaracinus amylolyticus TaxID=927083 RepID=A0A0F6YMD2_9BACT|nr:hypothetical protein [Sandaracinus amylolyticus]AKF11313.1 hypothetical protein DB32_008462 [Sandaracinus amylolyticus]
MPTFAALALATPLFGLSLQVPVLASPELHPDVVAQLAPGAPDPAQLEDAAIAAQLRQRQEIALVHRAFGVATWASMAATAVLGFIQFGDEYGFHGARSETACAQGTAVLQDFCEGTPWPHAVAGFTTAALYFTTFTLSFFMPDPLDLEHQQSDWAERVRIHRALRWVHLGGVVLQALLGIFIANHEAFGLDTNDDFDALQALAGVHMGVGIVTFGALSAAAALVTF